MSDLLPTVPGKVHGIVSVEPLTVQCDGCGETWSGDIPIITLGKALFNPRLHAQGVDKRRLCRTCADAAGWQS